MLSHVNALQMNHICKFSCLCSHGPTLWVMIPFQGDEDIEIFWGAFICMLYIRNNLWEGGWVSITQWGRGLAPPTLCSASVTEALHSWRDRIISRHTAVLKSLASNDRWSHLKEDAVDLTVFSLLPTCSWFLKLIGRSNAVYIQSQRALAAVLMSEINILCFSVF